MLILPSFLFFFFFNDTATTEIYTLSLHDALPISRSRMRSSRISIRSMNICCSWRSEEHTSELQSHLNIVCRLLLEKNKKEFTIDVDLIELIEVIRGPGSSLYGTNEFFVFFFNDTATTEIYTLSLHDALPI